MRTAASSDSLVTLGNHHGHGAVLKELYVPFMLDYFAFHLEKYKRQQEHFRSASFSTRVCSLIKTRHAGYKIHAYVQLLRRIPDALEQRFEGRGNVMGFLTVPGVTGKAWQVLLLASGVWKSQRLASADHWYLWQGVTECTASSLTLMEAQGVMSAFPGAVCFVFNFLTLQKRVARDYWLACSKRCKCAIAATASSWNATFSVS